MKHIGNLEITKENQADFKTLVEITGGLYVYSSASLKAPKLETVGEGLYVYSSASLEAPKLETVGGYLYVNSNASLEAPKLETVGEGLSVYSSASLKAPKLETVGEGLYVNSSASLEAPKLETVGGYLYVNSNASLEAPKLETVGEGLSVNSNASLEVPKLETVGRYLYVNSNASLEAPKLETVGGYLSVYSSASLKAPKLETVGEGLYVNSNASLEAPKLKRKNDPKARPKCDKRLAASFKKKKLVKADGILSRVRSRKKVPGGVAMRIQVVGKLEASFLIQVGTTFSHGKTLREAKDSLKYKISTRDTTEFKKWKKSTAATQAEMIRAYRAITGACAEGTRLFCEGRKPPNRVTVAEAIEITRGQYNHDKFAEFFE